MICMGIDSAGRKAGLALMQDDELLYEVSLNGGLTHSETLLELADTAFRATGLSPAQVDLYGVCAGPGSFTGLRIGLALVKGLAFAHHTPCAGVSTLAQTLAQAVERLYYQGMLRRCPRVELCEGNAEIIAQPKQAFRTEAAMVFWTVQNGIAALAESFPENVMLEEAMRMQ